MSGTLYLVGTPIGNLGDLSVRALETLRSADFIAAEDTRVTAKLLNHFEIRKPCVSYYEHNKYASGETRREHLQRLRGETRTMIFYEAPHKLLRTLSDLRDTFGGEREITLARELTKLHEQTLRTTLDGAVAHFTENAPKGEFVLVLRGAPERSEPEVTAEQALQIVARYRSEGRALKEACKLAAADTGFGKKELYQMALNI